MARNWYSRYGELDLVMLDAGTVAFIEVRYRKNERYGSAAESVDRNKCEKIAHTAQLYLLQHPQWQNAPCRFDVIAMQPNPKGGVLCNWIQHAFSL